MAKQQNANTIQIFFLVFSFILVTILFLSKFLHDRPRLRYYISEPAMTLLISMFFSFLASIFLETEKQEGEQGSELAPFILKFPSKVFFMALLPPILFNSGYQLQRELFYRHFTPIALFACLGTCICCFATGFSLYFAQEIGWFGEFELSLLELLTFGALIAATDTVSVVGILQAKRVDPHLFSLIFGESALNDAIAIVLFKTLSEFLAHDHQHEDKIFLIGKYLLSLLTQAVGSPVLGIIFSFCLGLAFKHVDLRKHQLLELALYILPIYIPFILSEVLNLSGMITIFFTGISAKRYMDPNVSQETKSHAETLFRLFSLLAETCIFIELGLSVFGLSPNFQWSFIGLSFIAALLGRALSVYPLSVVFNMYLARGSNAGVMPDDGSLDSKFSIGSHASTSSWASCTPYRKRDKLIPVNFMHFLWFSGLRGAVAYACACRFPDLFGHRDEIIGATMVIVLVTIIFMGGMTEALMETLQIRVNVDEKEYMRHWRMQRTLNGKFHRFGEYAPFVQSTL